MSAWMLDTAMAGHVIKGDRPQVTRRLAALPMQDIMVSAVTVGELLHGLARRRYPPALSERVRQFLLRVDVLPWDSDAVRAYADFRAACEAKGVSLGPFDMMIAAHAVAANAVLVTRDKTFARAPAPLRTADWAG